MARDLRLFYVYRLLATSYMWGPLFVLFMVDRGLDFSQVGVLGAIFSLTVVIMEIPTGAFADRIGRRQSMMAGALAMVASCLIFYFAHSFEVFVVAEVLAAVSLTLCSGADSAYLFDLLYENGRSDEYAQYEGRASSWHLGGNALTFALGGLIGSIDLSLMYLATAVTSGAAFVIAFMMRSERAPVAPQLPAGQLARDYLSHMRCSVLDVIRGRKLAWVVAYAAVAFVLAKAVIWLIQLLLESHAFSYMEIGAIFAGISVVGAVFAGQSDALRRHFGEDRLKWGLLAVLSVSYFALRHAPSQWVIPVVAVQAAAMGVYSPLVKIMLNREIPSSDRRATVLSVESIVRRVMMAAVLFGAGHYGPSSAMYLLGAVGCAGLVLLAVWWQCISGYETESRVPTITRPERSSPLDEPGPL